MTAPPHAFLLPGMHGLDPGFSRFASLCADNVELELLDHAGLEAPVAQLRDLATAGTMAAYAMEARRPVGPIGLVGYSYGGNVAYEAACVLRSRGRALGPLVLIDTALPTTDVDLHGLTAAKVRKGGVRTSSRIAAARLVSRVISPDDVRRRVGRVCDLLPGHHSHGARRHLVAFLRMEAIYDWAPNPLDARVDLVLSEQFAPAVAEGWRALCPGSGVTVVPGRHVDLFVEPALALAVRATGEAAARADAVPLP